MPPSILILTASIGHGHHRAADAIKQGLKKIYPQANIETIDFLEIMNKFSAQTGKKIYLESLKYFPSIYKFLYASFNKKEYVKILNLLNYPFIYLKLGKWLTEKNPDIIISTYPIWDYSISQIRTKMTLNAKLITVVTDSISIHAFWANPASDYFIVANQETAQSLKKLNIPEKKIKPLGFPLSLDFYKNINKDAILKKLNFTNKKPVLLFLPSVNKKKDNIGILQQIGKNLPDSQLIIITGQNQKIDPNLISNKHHLINWTDKMAELMQVADIIITKAGGATIQECIYCQKPVIITQIIPGHEAGNAQLIKKYKIGEIASTPAAVITSLKKIITNYDNYKKNFKKLPAQNSTLKIAQFIKTTLSQGESTNKY